MRYFIIILALAILSSCKQKPPQQQIEPASKTINKINRLDFAAQDTYATVPDISFRLIPNTDTFEVVQTVQSVTPVQPNQIIVKAGKKSDINILSPETESPDKIKAKGRAIVNTGEGEISKAPDKIKTKINENQGLVWISIVGVIVLGILAYFWLRKK